MTGLTHLSWDTCGNDDHLDTIECLVELVRRVALDLCGAMRFGSKGAEYMYLGRCVNVADVRCDTGCAANVVEAKRGDEGVRFEKERQWLADASSGAKDSDFGVSRCRGGEQPGLAGEYACC